MAEHRGDGDPAEQEADRAHYRNELARRLLELGYETVPTMIGPVPGFELADYGREMREAFSTRRRDILEDMKRRGVAYSAARAQQAALYTRRRKAEPAMQELRRIWQRRAREAGLPTRDAAARARRSRRAERQAEARPVLPVHEAVWRAVEHLEERAADAHEAAGEARAALDRLHERLAAGVAARVGLSARSRPRIRNYHRWRETMQGLRAEALGRMEAIPDLPHMDAALLGDMAAIVAEGRAIAAAEAAAGPVAGRLRASIEERARLIDEAGDRRATCSLRAPLTAWRRDARARLEEAQRLLEENGPLARHAHALPELREAVAANRKTLEDAVALDERHAACLRDMLEIRYHKTLSRTRRRIDQTSTTAVTLGIVVLATAAYLPALFLQDHRFRSLWPWRAHVWSHQPKRQLEGVIAVLARSVRSISGSISARFASARRVEDFRNVLFGACSAFTRVAARMVAEPPKAARLHRSASGHVVASITRSDCFRLERQLAGRGLHPLGNGAFPRRTIRISNERTPR